MIRRNLMRAGAVVLTASMLGISVVGCGSSKETASVTAVNDEAAPQAESAITSAINNELAISTTSTLKNNTRQQTVYVFDDATGKQDHTTVNTKVTDAKGETTSTSEESSKEAPVTIKVSYTLNGKEISPEELVGKSGKVKIRFDYTNNEKKEIMVNGQSKTAYVPFTVATGLMLDNEKFTNVEVTNGKVSKVGSDIVALGVTLPGLKDSLNLKFNDEALDLNIPEYFEVSADVKDFALEMSLSVVTSNLLSDMDLDNLSLTSLESKLTELQTAADQLADGTVKLQEGTQQLEDNVPALVSGVSALNDGAATLSAGVGSYAAGVSSLSAGAAEVDSNMQTLSSSLSTLYNTLNDNEFDTKVASLNEGINGASGLFATLSNGMSSYQNLYETTYADAYQKIFKANYMQELQARSMSPDMDAQAGNPVKTGVKNALAGKGITADANIQSVLTSETQNTAVYATAGLCEVYAGYSKLGATVDSEQAQAIISDIVKVNQYAAAYKAMYASYSKLKAAGLDTGVASLAGAIGSFDTYREGTLCSSLYALNAGAAKLQSEGTAKLAQGASTLNANNDALTSGAAQLANGTETLNNAASTLSSGVAQLNTGAITLKDGMAEFNKEGISKITSLAGADVQTAIDTIDEVAKLGSNYKTFTGSTGNYDSSVTFVYKTAAIQ